MYSCPYGRLTETRQAIVSAATAIANYGIRIGNHARPTSPFRNSKMKTQKPNAELVWKQIEDMVVRRLKVSVVDRSAYSHLLRHSRLENRMQLRFSIAWLARDIGLSGGATRNSVRRLVSLGALRLLGRSKEGHTVEVRLPDEIPELRRAMRALPRIAKMPDIEEVDFMRTRTLRKAILARDGELCFYCRKRLNDRMRCLDHVRPLSRAGRNSYRNLVSCCLECNSQKGERSAADLLRTLYRERRLTSAEFATRLRALKSLAAGKLRPVLPSGGELRSDIW